MTALSRSDIPDIIESAEELSVYSSMLLARVNPSLRILEAQGESTQAVQLSIVKTDDNSTRLISRVSIEISPDYATDTSVPFYAKALELSNTAVPSAFTA
jgi:hypothetical protein